MSASDLSEYLNHGRYKDGHARCIKLLKKNPSDPYLLISKAFFLRRLDRPVEAEDVVQTLLDRGPAITDLEAVEGIENYRSEAAALSESRVMSLGPAVNRLWNNGISNLAKDRAKEWHEDRLSRAIQDRRWIDAGYALSSWRKVEPNNRNLRSLHAAVYQIIAERSINDPQAAAMNSMLAFRTLDQGSDRPQNRPETLLYCVICCKQQRFEQIHQKHYDTYASMSADWAATQYLVKALLASESWKALRALTSSMLFANSSDDSERSEIRQRAMLARTEWRVWSAYLRAREGLQDFESPEEVLKPLPSADARYSCLADLWLRHRRFQDSTYESVLQFWAAFRACHFCFEDLKPYVLGLPRRQQISFRQHIASDCRDLYSSTNTDFVRWINAETNALKFEYLLTVGLLQPPNTEFLQAFVRNALNLWRLGLRQQLYTPDLPILICSALIRYHEVDPDSRHLLQAAYILEKAAKDNNAQAKVLLVYIYGELGLFSRAIRRYQDLSIKEMQHDTFGHALMTRISIGHPFGPHSRMDDYGDVSSMIGRAFFSMRDTSQKIMETQIQIADNGRSDLLLELAELRDSLDFSISHRIMYLEQRRLGRLTNRALDPKYTGNTFLFYNELFDNRDFKTTSNFAEGEAFIESRLSNCHKAPTRNWLVYGLWMDETWSLLKTGTSPHCPCLFTLEQNLERIKADSSLTMMEANLVPIWETLGTATSNLPTVVASSQMTPPSQQDLPTLVDRLHQDLDELPIDQVLSHDLTPGSPPNNALLQCYFLLFDLLMCLDLFCTTVSSANAKSGPIVPKKTIDSLRQKARNLFDALQQHARKQRARLSVNATAEKLRMPYIGGEDTEEAEDELSAEEKEERKAEDERIVEFSRTVVASAEDAFDGVLRVKMALRS